MTSPSTVISEALEKAHASGLEILAGSNGASSRWGGSWDLKELEHPNLHVIGVDWGSAVLWDHGLLHPMSKGQVPTLCRILGVDTYWWWRFHRGFSYLAPLKIIAKEGDRDVEKSDPLSYAAFRLAKQWL